MSFFASSWCRRLAAVCDCGTPWTFLLNCFILFLSEEVIEEFQSTCTSKCLDDKLNDDIYFKGMVNPISFSSETEAPYLDLH